MTQLSFFLPAKARAEQLENEAHVAERARWVRLSIARRNQVARYFTSDQMQRMEGDMRRRSEFVSDLGWIPPHREYGYWAGVLIELGLPAED